MSLSPFLRCYSTGAAQLQMLNPTIHQEDAAAFCCWFNEQILQVQRSHFSRACSVYTFCPFSDYNICRDCVCGRAISPFEVGALWNQDVLVAKAKTNNPCPGFARIQPETEFLTDLGNLPAHHFRAQSTRSRRYSTPFPKRDRRPFRFEWRMRDTVFVLYSLMLFELCYSNSECFLESKFSWCFFVHACQDAPDNYKKNPSRT